MFDVPFTEELANLIDKEFVSNSVAAVTSCVLPLFVTYGKSSNSRSSSRDVQLPGDLSLGAALGKQFGGAFPTGLAGDALLGGPRSCLLLAAVGDMPGMLLHQRPSITSR